MTELRAHGTLITAVRERLASMAGPGRSVDEVLRAADARFPPANTEALETLVLVGLPSVLDARTIRERVFRAEASADAPDALAWRVELESEQPLAPGYTLVFEPIEGRLISLVRR